MEMNATSRLVYCYTRAKWSWTLENTTRRPEPGNKWHAKLMLALSN